MRWYTRMGKRACLSEIAEFFFSKRLKNSTLSLRAFAGESLHHREESMRKSKGKNERPTIPIKAA